MRGWLRCFALNAQVRTGVSGWLLAWALIAAAAAAAAAVFLLVAAFVWLADRYGSLTAGVVLGCAFALIALIALVVLAGSVAKEWSARAQPAEDDAAEDDADSGSEG